LITETGLEQGRQLARRWGVGAMTGSVSPAHNLNVARFAFDQAKQQNQTLSPETQIFHSLKLFLGK
jgi:hypothetical protein